MANREHWQQHLCCMPARDVAGEGLNEDFTAGVYSSKNEGGIAYVLLSICTHGFTCDPKMLPDSARRLAAALVQAADRADEAQRQFEAVAQVVA